MGFCSDPRLTYLNDLGYNVVRLPRKGITPLGVIGCEKESKFWLGTLDQVWTSETAPPAWTAPQTVAGLNGQKTNDLKVSLGLEILGNALAGMIGAAMPSLSAAYGSATTLQFAFKDVQSVGIDPFALGNFLSKGELRPNPFVKRFLMGENGNEALVLTDVLQAKSVGVIGKRDGGAEVAVDVPQIEAVLGAKVKVTAGNARRTEVVYEGAEFLAFGYKAFGIRAIDGKWEVYGASADAGHAFAIGGPAVRAFVDSNALVDIGFDA